MNPTANFHFRRTPLTGWSAALVGLWVFTSVGASAAPALPCPIPLEKGIQWTYEGKVRWTPVNSGAMGPTNVHWVMEVLDLVTNQSARAAVVRGLPDELTGYEAGFQPGYSVLLCVSNRVYRFGEGTEQDARSRARELLRSSPVVTECNEFLVLPLGKGKEWAGDTERSDHWYRWYVEAEGRKRVRVKGSPIKRPTSTWRLAFRTCPEHEIMEITEGLGITRFVYEHHGTVQSVDVRLVSFKRPTVQ
ncbi:MAG: hypothetical protein AB9869_01355 [Verrucomicrobiia bacterium]